MSGFLYYPFFGLLADIKTDRYNTIIAGVYLSFVSWIICGVATIAKKFMNIDVLYLVVLGVAYILKAIAFIPISSNLILNFLLLFYVINDMVLFDWVVF